jgi:hypothetical protein
MNDCEKEIAKLEDKIRLLEQADMESHKIIMEQQEQIRKLQNELP